MRLIFFLSLFVGQWAFAQSLQNGNYTQACHVLGEDDHVSATLQVDQSHWRIHHVAYEDDNCTKAFFFYDEDITVTQTGLQLNLKTNSATMTAADTATADGLNAVSQCGYSQWRSNVAVDVAGKTCGEFQVPAASEMTYSLIQILSPTQVKLGTADDQHDGSSEAQRFIFVETAPFVFLSQ